MTQFTDRGGQGNGIGTDVPCSAASLFSFGRDLRGAVGHLVGGGGGLGHGLRDLRGYCALFLHRCTNQSRYRIDFAYGLFNPSDRGDGGSGGAADLVDVAGDFLGGACGLGGQGFDFTGDDGETLAGLAGPGCLDRRVQRQ